MIRKPTTHTRVMIMKNIFEHTYNRHQARMDKKFKIWKSAGLILTYKCSAACRFCYYNCNPNQTGLMPTDTAINSWQGLKKLAGDSAKMHFTGGEAFLYFDRMAEILIEAKKLKLGKIDQIETNGSWAENENIIKEYVTFLDAHGMKSLKISCDPFHAEFIDIGRIRLLVEIAGKILSPERVLVRWQEHLDNPIDMKSLNHQQKIDVFARELKNHPFSFTGKASTELAKYFSDKTAENFAQNTCKSYLLSSKGVHIDPFGNIFNGVCSGMIIGNVNKISLDKLWDSTNWPKMDFFKRIFESGPTALMKEAEDMGYLQLDNYASKCHICTDLRQFFFDNGRYTNIIGPKQCYN